jgi:anti-anti-sigma factor
MSDPAQPTFLVSAYSDPVVVQVNGKANYLNCNAFRQFIEKVIAEGSRKLFIDFEDCKGMDSTFLGILAGTAIQLRKLTPAGELIVGNLSERNYELICNLGLQNLLTISKDQAAASKTFDALKNQEVSDAKNILKAHENLTAADQENAGKFQDVIAFLRNQVEKQEKNSVITEFALATKWAKASLAKSPNRAAPY